METKEKVKVASVVSTDGEIVTDLYEGDKIIRDKSDDEYVYNFNSKKSFIKLFDEVLEMLNKRLTTTEFNFAMRLAKHISYDDCILRKNGHGSGKILTLEDISDIFDMNYKTVARIVNGLINKGVLGQHITGCKDNERIKLKCYTCNPYIFMRGNKVNKTILSEFQDSGWKNIAD